MASSPFASDNDEFIQGIISGSKKRSRKENDHPKDDHSKEVLALPMSQISELVTQIMISPDDFGEIGQKVEKSVPHMIICGDQSSGKSTLNNNLYSQATAGKTLTVKTSNGMTTLCPVEFHFVNKMVDEPFYGIEGTNRIVFQSHDEMIDEVNSIVLGPEMLQLKRAVGHYTCNDQEFTLVDMPGLFRNTCIFEGQPLDQQTSNTLSDHFMKLLGEYILKPNAIMLHVVNFSDDIANCTSIGLIRDNIKNIVARHIIIATKLDKSTRENVITNTTSLKNMFGQDIEIYYCIASLSHKREMERLADLIGNTYPSKYLGTQSLFKVIPDMVNTFVQEKISDLIPALKEVRQICITNLKNIGHVPKDVKTLAHEWAHKLHNLIIHYFSSNRRDINKLIDDYTQTGNNNYIQLLKDVCNIDEHNLQCKLQESKYSRGTAFRDTTHIDGPSKELIIEKGQLVHNTFNYFHKQLQEIIQNVISQLLLDINNSFPQCVKMTNIIHQFFKSKIDILLDEYKNDIDKFIHESCHNPSDRQTDSYLRSVSVTAINIYTTVQRHDISNGMISVNNLKQWIKTSPEFNNTNIQTNIIRPFVGNCMIEIVKDYFNLVDIRTKTLAENLKDNLYGEHIYQLLDRASELVSETDDVVSKRERFKTILELTNKVLYNQP